MRVIAAIVVGFSTTGAFASGHATMGWWILGAGAGTAATFALAGIFYRMTGISD